MQTKKLTRQQLIILLLIAVVILGLSAYMINAFSKPTLTIKTDTKPVSFELHDKQITLNNDQTNIRLAPGVYKYRAKTTVSKNTIVYSGSITIKEGEKNEITLGFELVNESSIRTAICRVILPASCTIDNDDLLVKFSQDYSWAVVKISPDNQDNAFAVLRAQDGQWIVETGPATDIEYSGRYPEETERMVRDVQK
jgi:hypothetical protein